MGQVKEGCVLLAPSCLLRWPPGLCHRDAVNACSERVHPWRGSIRDTSTPKQQLQTQAQAGTTTSAAGTPASHKLPPFQQLVTLTSLMRSMVNKAANLLG